MTFKFVLDLWNIGNGGGQQPNSGVHEEISAGRVKAYMGQSNKKWWNDYEGYEHLQAGEDIILGRYWSAFKRLWPVRIGMTWCERLWTLTWMKHSGLVKNERLVDIWRYLLHSLLHSCSSVLLIACFMHDRYFGDSIEASFSLTAWVSVAMDSRALVALCYS